MSFSLRHPVPDLPLGLDANLRPALEAILAHADLDALLVWQQRHGALRTLEPSSGQAWAHRAWTQGHRDMGDMLLAAGCRPFDEEGSALDWVLSAWRQAPPDQSFAWETLFSQLTRRPTTPRLRRWEALVDLTLASPPEVSPCHDRQRLMLHRLAGQPTAAEAQVLWQHWVQAIANHPNLVEPCPNPAAVLRPTFEFLLVQALWRRLFAVSAYESLASVVPLPSTVAPAVDPLFTRLSREAQP